MPLKVRSAEKIRSLSMLTRRDAQYFCTTVSAQLTQIRVWFRREGGTLRPRV